ncbi:NAD-dependent epimerase/dehydratase family protein [Salinithrix halophila]|uniref:NAD-dependent epimerase/dehydratase family protein n=1 Tax=Salinithrix halophila TaxID=1485204 RepID=A0ABV8JGV9_9BACL
MSDRLRVCITGINGFVGKHFVRHLISDGVLITGTGRKKNPPYSLPDLSYLSCNLLDYDETVRLIRDSNYDYVIHLAAENRVLPPGEQSLSTIKTNVFGTLNLLDALRAHTPTRLKGILIIGSAHEYAISAESGDQPLAEDHPVAPFNLYGWSKHLQTLIAQRYAQLYDLPTMIARTFNLVGPGTDRGLSAEWAKQTVEIEKNVRPPVLRAGNINVARDFLDVRDAVRAYWQLLQAKNVPPGTLVNVCSGRATQLEDILSLFQKHSRTPFRIETDPTKIREKDPPSIRGSNQRLNQLTGWTPSIPLIRSVTDLLEEYRNTL